MKPPKTHILKGYLLKYNTMDLITCIIFTYTIFNSIISVWAFFDISILMPPENRLVIRITSMAVSPFLVYELFRYLSSTESVIGLFVFEIWTLLSIGYFQVIVSRHHAIDLDP